jgi:hypothetical protein
MPSINDVLAASHGKTGRGVEGRTMDAILTTLEEDKTNGLGKKRKQ